MAGIDFDDEETVLFEVAKDLDEDPVYWRDN